MEDMDVTQCTVQDPSADRGGAGSTHGGVS